MLNSRALVSRGAAAGFHRAAAAFLHQEPMPGAQLRFDHCCDEHELEWMRVVGSLEPLPFPAAAAQQQGAPPLDEDPCANEHPDGGGHHYGVAPTSTWSPLQLAYWVASRRRAAASGLGGELLGATEDAAAGAAPLEADRTSSAGAAAGHKQGSQTAGGGGRQIRDEAEAAASAAGTARGHEGGTGGGGVGEAQASAAAERAGGGRVQAPHAQVPPARRHLCEPSGHRGEGAAVQQLPCLIPAC
jgi:hypothetical protein